MNDLRRAGGRRAGQVILRRAAFLSGGSPLDVFADALFGAETPEEERRLVSERHAQMSTELTGVLGNELERAGIKVARDLASADLAAFGASPDLVRRVEVLLRFLAPGSAVGRPKGLPPASANSEYRNGPPPSRGTGPHKVPDVRVRPVALPYDPRFQRGPFDAAGAGRLLKGWSEGRKTPIPHHREPAQEAFRVKAQGGDAEDYEVAPAAEWIFSQTTPAPAPIAEKRRPRISDARHELVPLHLQPQEFVGGHNRSGKLHKRVLERATNYFAGYQQYTQTRQLFRDEPRAVYEQRTGDIQDPPGTLETLSEELLRNSHFQSEAPPPMPSVSTVKTASTMIRTPYGVVKAAEKRKPRRRMAPRRRRPRPVDPADQLRSLIDKVDSATLDSILAEKRPPAPAPVEEAEEEETPELLARREALWSRFGAMVGGNRKMKLCFTWNPSYTPSAAARCTSRRTGSCRTSTRSGIDPPIFFSAFLGCQKHTRRGRSNTRHSRGRHRPAISTEAPYQIPYPQRVPRVERRRSQRTRMSASSL